MSNKLQIKILSIEKSVVEPCSGPSSLDQAWEEGVNAKFFVNGSQERATLVYQCDKEKLTLNGWPTGESSQRRYGWNFIESHKLVECESAYIVFKHLFPKGKQAYVVNMHITPGAKQLSMVKLGALITYQIEIYGEVPWRKTKSSLKI